MDDHGHCKDYLSNFSDYLDGDLDPELCTQLQAHLRDCADCRVVFNTMQKTIELYRSNSETEELPEQVRSRLFARLNLEIHTPDVTNE